MTVEIFKTFCFQQFREQHFERRTEIAHSRHCEEANNPVRSLADHHMMTNGVERDSILNKLQYFHVLKGLCPDIMHDILEGR